MLGKICCRYIILIIFQYSLGNFETIPPDTENRLVQSNAGTIRGLKAADGAYFMYLGIPYATVDTRNPFASSIPSLLFDKVLEAYDDSYVCPHTHQKNETVIGTLDCLRLNVYVPETNSMKEELPVMVWIHGGSFKFGHGSKNMYGPRYLLQHDVVVVTVNYRTGPYGFMCLDMPEVSGNQGLKDQYLALQWVKDNIDAFGGDPNQITLFGEGAGAHSIDLHLISNKAALYDKVILQSGSAQSITVLRESDKLAALKMARYVGFRTDDMKDALYYLANTDIHLVLAAAQNLNIQFRPCVESLFDNVEPFISSPWTDSKIPKIKNMPVLMGFNKHELTRSLFSKNVKSYNSSSVVYDHIKDAFYLPEQEIIELADLIAHFYFADEKAPEKVTWEVIRFISDFTYIHPIHRTLQRYLENGAGNIYFYMLTYVGKMNAVVATTDDEDEPNSHLCCVSHADELSYLFDTQNQPELIGIDETVMQRMTTMWTNFAKYSNPIPIETELLPIKWQSVKPNNLYYLDIGTNLSLGVRPLHARMAFWDLFYRHNMKYQQGYEED